MKNTALEMAMDEFSVDIKQLAQIMCCSTPKAQRIIDGVTRPTDSEMGYAMSALGDHTLFRDMVYDDDKKRVGSKKRKPDFDPADTIKTLMDSCVEGRTGEWDCSCEEGRESFGSMYEHLRQLAEHFGLSVKGVKEMP